MSLLFVSVVVSDSVIDFLIASGGGTIDEIVARVSGRPQYIAESLKSLQDNGCLAVDGPKTVKDFAALVEVISGLNGYNHETTDEQRNEIISQITKNHRDFMETFVRPTRRAFALTL